MVCQFQRHPENPILTVKDLPEDAGYFLLNPGAVKFNGTYLLLIDVFHKEGGIVFWIARSQDGIHFQFDPAPPVWPACEDVWEENGCYDPRITEIDGEFIIMYGSHNNILGTRLGIVKTTDFIHFERVSNASEVNNRNGALFPEKINGLYCRFDRPFAGDEHSPCDMWLSFSPDLVFWGKTRPSLTSRPAHWDQLKVSAGAPPIRIKEGWLEIYHGVSNTCDGSIYSLFAAILDYKEPWKVIARSKTPLLFPEAPYECSGRVSNVVFTCNAILEPDDTVRIYYGAADSCIGCAEMPLADIVKKCFDDYHYMLNCKK